MRGLSRKTILLGAAAALVICVGASVLVTLPRSSSPLLQQTQISAQQSMPMPPPPPPVPQQSMPPPQPTAQAPAPPQTSIVIPASQPPSPEIAAMPGFPWPPPKASAWDDIPRELLHDDSRHSTFADAEIRLRLALGAAGYYQRSLFVVPGGFAIVTQFERIEADGTPANARRWQSTDTESTFSLDAYFKQLLYAQPGRYRLVVLIVSDVPFSATGGYLTASDASDLASRGVNVLPKALADEIFSINHRCTALIYEFRKGAKKELEFVTPSPLLGRDHLVQAKIWSALEGVQKKLR